MSSRVTLPVVVLALAPLALGPVPTRADSIPARLARLEARIAVLEASARQPAQGGVDAEPDPEGEKSLRSQDLLRERRGEAESELAQANAELRDAKRRLALLIEVMSERLVVMYKTRRPGTLPALSSARDLQVGLRLASDLNRVVESDARLFAQYRRRLEEVEGNAARSRALSLRVEDADLAYERQRRIDALNALELRRLRGRRALRLAAELREVAKQLETRPRAGTGPASLPRPGTLARPVAGPLRARFGARLIPELDRVPRRSGIEIEAPRGTAVRAVASGRVIFADALKGYGQLVIVEHAGGLVSVSGGLERRAVDVGERIEAGRVLGTVGEARWFDGAGLYFELRRDGLPIDPEPWFERESR